MSILYIFKVMMPMHIRLTGIEAIPDEEFHVGVGQVLGLVCGLLLGDLGLYELEIGMIAAKFKHLAVFLGSQAAGLAQERGNRVTMPFTKSML